MVSTTLAFPLQAWSQPKQPLERQMPKMGFVGTPAVLDPDGITTGAVVQKYRVNGEDLTVTMATVEAKDEAQFIEELAEKHPDNTLVAFSDKNDPAFAAAKKSSFFSRLKSVFVGKKIEDLPALHNEAVPAKTRKGIVERVKTYGRHLKENKVGVLFSVAYASGMSAFSYYQSASVEAALAQFLPTLIWSMVLTVHSNKWFQYLDKSGAMAENIGKLIGQNTNPAQAHSWNATGQFLGTLAANSLLALYTLYMSGGLLGAFQVAWMGFLMNSNVVDPTVRRWHTEGKVSEKFINSYMPLMQMASAVAEIAAFFGVPFVGMALGVVVMSGLTYLLAGPTLEKKVSIWKRSIAGSFRRAGYSIRGQFNSTLKECAKYLAAPKPYVPPPEEFVSWASLKHSW